MKTITISGIVAAFLFVIAPAHADTEYFFCYANSGALDDSGLYRSRYFVSDVLPVDEDDYSEFSTERNFRGYLKDEYGGDIDFVSCSAPAVSDRSAVKDLRRIGVSSERDNDHSTVITVDESDWDGDY